MDYILDALDDIVEVRVPDSVLTWEFGVHSGEPEVVSW